MEKKKLDLFATLYAQRDLTSAHSTMLYRKLSKLKHKKWFFMQKLILFMKNYMENLNSHLSNKLCVKLQKIKHVNQSKVK